MLLTEILHLQSKNYADKPALIFGEQQVSFRQFHEQVLHLAAGLCAIGVGKGDKVAIYLPNCLEFAYAYLAGFYLGAVCVPLDFQLKEEELISCLSHSESKVLIARSKTGIDWQTVKNGTSHLQKIIAVGSIDEGAWAFEKISTTTHNPFKPALVADIDPALIMYTSGTTGKPKGILLNYKHLEGSPAAMQYFVDLSDRDVKLAAIPLSHIGGFIYLQNCIHFGITLILMDRFNPIEFLEKIVQYQVTCFHIVPPMYTAILTLKNLGMYDLSSLRWIVVFGAPSSPEILQRFHQHCPNARLLNGWGMTETCPPNTVTPLDSDNIDSVGKPAPNCVIRILDAAGQVVPTGEIGEIVISGWIVMQEYYKDPEATAEMKRPEGLYTGDLGRFDAAGFLYIVGRKKEMIKVGGQIVYAPEVESVLYQHSAVAEAAVIGVPDALRGESVKAFVVLKEGQQVSPEDLRYVCRDRLAHFKVPQVVEIREQLAKNRVGKIDKSLLA
ncbi:MAG: AMP-binding protein [Candidatus Omnitrophica bacterium]|nr:AMP-binding protein [Candidatus Omnitrophota bacterium]